MNFSWLFFKRGPSPEEKPHRHGSSSSELPTVASRSAVHRHHHQNEQVSQSHGHRTRDGRREIGLVDLDAERREIKVAIKPTSQLSHAESFLRRRFDHGEHLIDDDAQVRFSSSDNFPVSVDIPRTLSSLYYRVLRSGDNGDLMVRSRKAVPDDPRFDLDTSQLRQLSRDTQSGCTIDDLRQTAAKYLKETVLGAEREAPTSDQIVVKAVGGLRPGPIQGSNWEARKVKTWQCRYLEIELTRPNDYLILKGINQQYIWHRPKASVSQGPIRVRDLKRWLQRKVLTTIHERVAHRCHHKSEIELNDIRISHHGRVLEHGVVWTGSILEFQLSRSAEDQYVQAEAWLLPQSETCVVCSDDKRVSEMPNDWQITAGCEHKASTCKDCVAQWITSSLETVSWDRLKCAECPRLLAFQDVRALATAEAFKWYDALSAKAALSSIREFQWCLNPRCEAGQINPSSCSKAKCHACKHYSCAQHQIPWHHGETCEQYDRRTRKQRKNDRLSEKHVKEITKPCPGCDKNVNKYSGCDHITCICGHEWCWLCFATYYRDDNGFLQCKHKQECRYRENPPNYEGGRAFMPFLNFAGGMPMRPPPPFRPNRQGRPLPPRQEAGPQQAGEPQMPRARQEPEPAQAARPPRLPHTWVRGDIGRPAPPPFPFDIDPFNPAAFFIDQANEAHRNPFTMNDNLPRITHVERVFDQALLFDLAQFMQRTR
ncbi:hypothetical protein F5Y15DRAFT_305025 [Xylariaceae sp. FL0016]|nr:hypothetical protein F5Y15DRAFT_305025 [Xylariaceae sp. FL0016]